MQVFLTFLRLQNVYPSSFLLLMPNPSCCAHRSRPHPSSVPIIIPEPDPAQLMSRFVRRPRWLHSAFRFPLTHSVEDDRRVDAPSRSLLRSHRRPGGLGALPTRGSHRPVRARIRAYGSSDHGFATFRYPTRLSVPVSVTRGSDFDASVVVLKYGSMIRRLASLHWLQQGAVRRLQWYYQDAMTF